VSVWKEGDSIAMVMDGHKVTIKLQPWEWQAMGRSCSHSDSGLATCPTGGLRTLALALKQREVLAETPKIAMAPSPTQWDIVNGTLSKLALAEERHARAMVKDAERKAKAAVQEREANLAKTDPTEYLRKLGLID
jgi:hypothetical protein